MPSSARKKKRPKVLSAPFPFVNPAGSRAPGFSISPASLRLSNDVRPAHSRQEHVGRHAKVPRQSPHVIERQLAFAAQNHRTLFFFNVPPPTETYTLSLHDALPI